MRDKSLVYSGLVWLVAAGALFLYATAGYVGLQVPGVEQLVSWLEQLNGSWILATAFISILIEGLYFFGSFLPGSTMIVVVAVLAQLQSWTLFALTIISIFLGWVVSGIINIMFARQMRRIAKQPVDVSFEVQDKAWETWFPSFRANYEVAQVISGAPAWKVFWSSVRVKLWGSAGATIYVLLLPLFIDVTELQNDAGFLVMFIVALIMLVVGVIQLRAAHSSPQATDSLM